MNPEINRLLLEYERLMREANHATINPIMEDLSLEDLRPLVEMVARSRAAYLKALHELAAKHQAASALPSDEEMQNLGRLRTSFIDLVEGSKSFETAIQRGYLDVKSR